MDERGGCKGGVDGWRLTEGTGDGRGGWMGRCLEGR